MTTTAPPLAALLAAACLAFFPVTPALAQADTAAAREAVADINGRLARLERAGFRTQRPEVEYASQVKAWADAQGVRKLEVLDRDDSGDVVTEYYFAGGALVFAYRAIRGYNEAGRQATRSEDRQYFRDGKMFRWLGGLEKAAVAPGDPEFATEGRERLAAADFYLQAARRAFAARPSPAR
jgi:hypothetical protein